jgi:hypothetical protein
MPEFESIIKLLILVGGLGGLSIGAAFAIKALFRKPPPDPLLHERLAEAEQRLADLEERADFAERVISDVRGRPALPRTEADSGDTQR